jgi:hypothetical protein
LWGREKQRQRGEIELLVAMGDQITIVSSLLGEQELVGKRKTKRGRGRGRDGASGGYGRPDYHSVFI